MLSDVGVFLIYFLNSLKFKILSKLSTISLNLIFFCKKRLTSSSLALVITVSYNVFFLVIFLISFKEGNLILSTLKKFILLSEENVELDYSQIFIRFLTDEEPEINQLSLEGLWEYEGREIIDPVISLLDKINSVEVRISAISLLGIYIMHALDKKIIKRDADKIINQLKLIFKNEKDINIRKKVLEAISPYGDEEINIFINQTYKSNNIEFKKSAIFSMGQTYNEKWLPKILSELDSINPGIRFEAVNAYAKLCNSNNISPIVKLIKDNDHEIRIATLNDIGVIGGETSIKFLETISNKSNSSLSKAANEI